jgi:hypothetical protein
VVERLPVLRSSSGTRVPAEEAMRKQKCRAGKNVEQPIYDTSRFGKSSQRDRPAPLASGRMRVILRIILPTAY